MFYRENRLLEDDLTNMTAETQRLSNDIKELIDERAQLSDQVQDYICEVKRVEDVLAQKVCCWLFCLRDTFPTFSLRVSNIIQFFQTAFVNYGTKFNRSDSVAEELMVRFRSFVNLYFAGRGQNEAVRAISYLIIRGGEIHSTDQSAGD